MMKFLAALLTASLLLAQNPTPSREDLLRERVSQFWKAFEEGKYRRADALVLDDDEAKDAFFAWPKKQIYKQEKSDIAFSEDGKTAKVLTPVETDEMMPRVGRMRLLRPVITFWKFDAGEWWWYQPKNQLVSTPFGQSIINATKDPAQATPDPARVARPITLEELWKLVTPDKSDIKFSLSKPGQQEIQFKNGMPGAIRLILDVPPREEFSVSVDPPEIPRGSIGTVIVKYAPLPAERVVAMKPGIYDLRVTVAQTGKTHTIKITME